MEYEESEDNQGYVSSEKLARELEREGLSGTRDWDLL